MDHEPAQAEIRGGIVPEALRALLPDPKDLEAFRYAALVANETYKHIPPQQATKEDRRMVLVTFADKVEAYVETTYHG